MSSRVVHLIVIHCSATPNGRALARDGRSAAEVIDVWHGQPVYDRHGRKIRDHMFYRTPTWRMHVRGHLWHIGYHRVIDVDGSVEQGRDFDEQGAHADGHNYNSLGFCMAGTDKFTPATWAGVRSEVTAALALYPHARVCGHRDLSPDKDGDGVVEKHEWLKTCPGFDASAWWLLKNLEPMEGHILESTVKRSEA